MTDPVSGLHIAPPARRAAPDPAQDPALWQAARSLEASFISEMLKSAGFGEALQGLGGGGPGEEQFASFLRHAHAEAIVEAGGLGLSEHLFAALVTAGNRDA